MISGYFPSSIFHLGQQMTFTTVLCLSVGVFALVNKCWCLHVGKIQETLHSRQLLSATELWGVMRENKLKTGQNQYRLPNSIVACVCVCVHCAFASLKMCVFTWSVTAFNVSNWGKTTNCLLAHILLTSGAHTHLHTHTHCRHIDWLKGETGLRQLE